MIDTSPFEHCQCRATGNLHDLCQSELSLEEKGKKVRLSPGPAEEAVALVLDGCVFRDNELKCDALFLFRSRSEKVAALVELKGAGDIPHAFEQLAYTQKNRPEYATLLTQLNASGLGRLREKAFVITNGQLARPHHEKLEKHHGVRVTAVLHSEACSKVPDLRDYL